MPQLEFAQTNGIRMGYYDAGPKTDTPPVILCHGWPEIAFSWRHQLKALSEAGIRVIAPDQRGYGSTDRPEAVDRDFVEVSKKRADYATGTRGLVRIYANVSSIAQFLPALGADDGAEAGREPAVGGEGLPKIGVYWDQSATAVLGRNIAQLDY